MDRYRGFKMTEIYLENWINQNYKGFNLVVKKKNSTGKWNTYIIGLDLEELKLLKKVVVEGKIRKGYRHYDHR